MSLHCSLRLYASLLICYLGDLISWLFLGNVTMVTSSHDYSWGMLPWWPHLMTIPGECYHGDLISWLFLGNVTLVTSPHDYSWEMYLDDLRTIPWEWFTEMFVLLLLRLGKPWTEAVGTKQHQTQGTKRSVPSSVWVQQNSTARSIKKNLLKCSSMLKNAKPFMQHKSITQCLRFQNLKL